MRKTAQRVVLLVVCALLAATAAATLAVSEKVGTTSLRLTRTERIALGFAILFGRGRTHFTNVEVDGVRYRTCDRFQTSDVVLVCCYNAEHDPDMLLLPTLFEVRGGCQLVPNSPLHEGYRALVTWFPQQRE